MTPVAIDTITPGAPLSTLLSHVLVAFTIEFDNEFERQMPHRTTNHRASSVQPGPWLVSLAMWSNCMQFVPEHGITVRELERLARTATNWNGMERWGYIVVNPDPADSRPRPPRSDWIVHATPKGRRAQEVWRPLFGVIEDRWRARFGEVAIDRLRESLGALTRDLDPALPDCLPILGYGLFSRVQEQQLRTPIKTDLSLPALLSRLLLAFAIEFEREWPLSLAIGANILRVLDDNGIRLRDLPLLTGVSKESIAMALGILRKAGVAVIGSDPAGGRGKTVRLTPKGREAQDLCRQRIAVIETRWQAQFGKRAIVKLRESLEALAGKPGVRISPLLRGLEPWPDGWRAAVPKPGTLPHYPMVLHRGGFPDGS
jgi:DNA-binding MarR family transcriptional regulator